MTPNYYSEKKGWAENPITNAQTTAMAKEAAGLLQAYGQTAADVDKNVWTHGEWERYAVKKGILPSPVQRWDLDSLTPPPYAKHAGGFWKTNQIYSKGGDQMRAKIKAFMTGAQVPVTSPEEPKSGNNLTGGAASMMSGSRPNNTNTNTSSANQPAITATKPKPTVKPLSAPDRALFFKSIRELVDGPVPAPTSPSPGVNIPDLNAAAFQDPRKRQVLGIGG